MYFIISNLHSTKNIYSTIKMEIKYCISKYFNICRGKGLTVEKESVCLYRCWPKFQDTQWSICLYYCFWNKVFRLIFTTLTTKTTFGFGFWKMWDKDQEIYLLKRGIQNTDRSGAQKFFKTILNMRIFQRWIKIKGNWWISMTWDINST